MALVIVSETLNLQPWIVALKKADPEVEVITLQALKDPGKVAFALAWNHRPGIFREFPKLKTISSMGAGVDHLMRDPDIPQHIRIVRIIDPLLSQDMYEFVLALILSRMKNLRLFQEQQKQKLWKKKRYLRLDQVRIGIMGTGIIGHHVASGLLRVGFQVFGWSRSEGQPTAYQKFFGEVQLKDFLGQTDILVCLLPLTPETKGILNRKHLSMLPEGAWVINVGRGAHVVDEELMEVIDSGHLDGASLDVFNEEPLSSLHPFWSHPKIHISPHNASLTDPDSVAPQILENYYRTLRGEPLLNMVNREAGY
ncbi:MAG: glyoxylate/hydroxypyruvate reductase A [Bacteroides sp.]|jgi:glyoxylate/hydroxypyruvate reductase A|nr:glyoxylate/hydroxypyruvate reductase A [Bacteroides sp.]